MRRRVPSLRFVVDTDIARAAGSSDHPVSSACRVTLNTIRSVCHRLVLSPTQRGEWEKHKSGFTSVWLTSMLSKRKCEILPRDPDALITDAVDRYEGGGPADRKALVKDEHLVEMALATDSRILSMDERAFRRFGEIVGDAPQVGRVHWGNPTHAPDDVVAWLEQGAPDDEARCIGTRPCPLDAVKP